MLLTVPPGQIVHKKKKKKKVLSDNIFGVMFTY